MIRGKEKNLNTKPCVDFYSNGEIIGVGFDTISNTRFRIIFSDDFY